MNYTKIIILLILLFCMYQMCTQSNKERFGGATGGQNLYADTVYTKDRECPPNSTTIGSSCYSEIFPLTCGKNEERVIKEMKKCVEPENIIKLCPKGYTLEGSECIGETMNQVCPNGYETTVDLKSNKKNCAKKIDPVCPNDYVLSKSGSEIKCCPTSKPNLTKINRDWRCKA